MLRKLMILGALLGVVTAGAMRPAEASHTLDNVVASVNGGVNLGAGAGTGLGACTVDTTDDGYKVQFTDVIINGVFIAGDDGLAGINGAVDVDDVDVCLTDDASAGPVPVLSHGWLAPAGYQTPSPAQNPLDPTGDDVCLYGDLHGGTFSNTGAVLSRALITTDYTVNEAVDGQCPVDVNDRGDEIASSADSVLLEADVVVIPAGQIDPSQFEDQVSAQVHSVHHGIDELL